MEKKYLIQDFEWVTPEQLLPRVKELKREGYRLGQACATRQANGNVFILYSFDKDYVLKNLKMNVPASLKVQSITGDIWSAFIYENEMHDLFGIEFENLVLDYGGKFFKVSTPTPWNPVETRIKEDIPAEPAAVEAPAAAEAPAAPAEEAPAAAPAAAKEPGVNCDTNACVFCGMCGRNCPVGAITVDRASKSWTIDRDTCIQCGVCIDNCPKKCLEMV